MLIDVSNSMHFGRRLNFVDSVINNYQGDYIKFAEKIGQAPEGNATNIGAVLEYLRQDPGPVIIITDGNYNQGPDPIKVARAYPFPIYPIRMPEDEILNIKVIRINGPDYMFIGDPGTFTVEYRTSGIDRPIRFTITQNGRIIEKRNSEHKSDGIYELEFSLVAKTAGKQNIKATAHTDKPETDYGDNHIEYNIEVNSKKINLLYISNLSPDVGIMRRIISDIRWITGEFRVNITDNKTVRFGQLDENPDIIIVNDIPQIYDLFPDLLKKLKSGLGLIVLAGRQTKSPILDFEFRKQHEMISPIPDPIFTSDNTDLPPFDACFELIKGHGTTRTLVQAKSGEAIVVDRNYEKGKVVIMLSYPFWRFYLRLAGEGREGIGRRMIRMLIELASPLHRKRRLVIHPIRKRLKVGEDAVISCGYYSNELKPITGAIVYFTISKNSKLQELIGQEKNAGYYRSEWRPESPGEYQIVAQAEENFDTISVAVTDLNIENSYQPVNRIFLNQLAKVSMGRIIEADEIPLLCTEKVEVVKKANQFPFNQPVVLIALVGLLSFIWFLRKKEGLP